jgi:hypothetical protein
LPLVPLVLLIPVASGKFATSVKNTGGQYAAGINATGANMPPVSTTPALGAWGKLIHEKEPGVKNLVAPCPIMSADELSQKNKF